MASNTISNEEKGINALSVDAGSLASMMSSIGVLEELMRRVQEVLGLTTLPNPCDQFDFMVGAGFAGLLVIMLGRLRMSLDNAKMYCSEIVNEVFSEKKRFRRSESFKATKLEAAVKRMLESCGAGADARMMDARAVDRGGCRVMVCVASERGMRAGAPVCLRTYTVSRNSVPDCTIVEAVRATFALSGLFKPAVITESGGVKMSYIGLGGMNPTPQLLEEAVHIFPHVTSVMSIGAGHKQITATDTERAAQEMTVRFINRPSVYFRFSVEQGMIDIGLAEWEKLSDGIVHARAYLALSENEPRIKQLAQAFSAKQKAVPVAHLNGALPIVSNANHKLQECPPPSPLFVGRETQLGRVKKCLINGAEERHVCVVHGLGGAGKTQLALKFAELYKNDYQHIFYVDATSAETIEAALKNIALAKHVGDSSSDALTWLAGLRENWLLLYNNADNTSLKLRGYFPACSHGNILITTRNHRMVNLAQGVDAECHVSEMSGEDAERLLAKAAKLTGEVGSSGLALIKELGCFALAIVQAGAYIHTRGCTVAEYLEMYRASKGQLLEEYAEFLEKADDYVRTAYATWRVSYSQLKPLAKQLFDLLAFMHHDQITEDIFRYATIGLKDDACDIPPTDDESATEQKTKSMLSNFTRLTDDSWDKAAFMRAIDDLQSYSLVAYDRLNRTYSIHPLVHDWTRTMAIDDPATCSCTSLLLASSVIWKHEAEDIAFRRTLVNHIDSLPPGEKMRPRLVERFWLVYQESGREKDAEILIDIDVEAKTKLHGRDHHHTLRSMNNLALTYSSQGRWQEAEVLQREVLELTKRVEGPEHPDTLTSVANLALTYSGQGRWQEAEVLQREVLELTKRVKGPEHPHTLTSMNNLASTYSGQGRWQEAEVLQREVMELMKRVRGPEHPETLRSMANLAGTYSSQGRWQEAEALQREVLELRKRVQGAEHPDTLASMANLALTYWKQGRWQEAEVLGREVLELRKRVQGPKHPDTLTSMNNLALTCFTQGRWQEAEVLQRDVLELITRAQGAEHPDTLASMGNLSFIYLSQGRWQEAEVLGRELLSLNKRVRVPEHPETLTSMSNLALTYSGQGRWQEAEVLEQEVLEHRKRMQGAEHPNTLTSMANLGSTYSSQGRWQEAEVLEREVLELRKQVLGAEHPETLTSMGNLALTYSRQGRWPEAEVLQREALDLKKRVIGSSHPDTLTSMHRLAVVCCDLGRVREAETLMIVAVDESKRMLGGVHPDTVLRLEYLDELQRRMRAEDTLVE